jgi:hypothetical protein
MTLKETSDAALGEIKKKGPACAGPRVTINPELLSYGNTAVVAGKTQFPRKRRRFCGRPH